MYIVGHASSLGAARAEDSLVQRGHRSELAGGGLSLGGGGVRRRELLLDAVHRQLVLQQPLEQRRVALDVLVHLVAKVLDRPHGLVAVLGRLEDEAAVEAEAQRVDVDAARLELPPREAADRGSLNFSSEAAKSSDSKSSLTICNQPSKLSEARGCHTM